MNARTALVVVSVAAGLFWTGCGVPGDGTVKSCVGSFSGTFAGSSTGIVTSSLHSTGKFVTTFFSAAVNDRVSTAMVADSGTIDGGTGDVIVTGTFNLDECTASGDWSRDTEAGTWSVEKR